ncbi:efflux transporter outer membrane subunit [Rugamonas rubra]|uniref:Efflux transporter, outer membrane factor (OMF) lipoprotein, NodT family n=1 Tax=Rugamonas rubra TaxID=758825 RepID=A0A1I4JW86_9BURK|nr:efflux transporter outer membrane subunit [Rugamonas rubra]SFL70366.1 efflux transporter, outer membrane factor (OMF) lipoprotein, NodT family [Rugamonas rubra]
MTRLRTAGLRTTALLAAAGALSACASQATPPQVAALAPPEWQAPLPHHGNVAELSDWWRRQDDALLVQLIDAAQQVSPTVATAAARIAQARAERVASGAALAPTLDGAASVGRSSQQSAIPLGTTSQAALQASWEIDLFGAGRAARDAAQARLDGAGAGWHDARVSVAAEVANQYYGQRACEQLLAVARQDAASRADTARLTELSAKAGFQSPASAALARASAADGSSRATAQRASCELGVKALVALSGIAEPELRQRLADGAPRWAAASGTAAANAATPSNGAASTGGAGPALAIAALPAQTLAQRPDVFNAEREVAAASAEVDGAQAQRYPRLTLSGAVGVANFRSDGQNTKADTWSIGPLALSLPIFDGGRRRANVVAAAARYDSAVAAYRASVRQAVREVEEALVNLDSSGARAGDARTALDGYRANFVAVEERYKNGLASLFELEDARRSRLAAEDTVVSLQRERSSAWVALYRAAGGGWNPATSQTGGTATASATTAATR